MVMRDLEEYAGLPLWEFFKDAALMNFELDEEERMAEQQTVYDLTCGWCGDTFNNPDRRTDHILKFHSLDLTPPPCKHEWRQYMANSVGKDETDEYGYVEPFLQPDGFFCIHCTERKD